MEFLKAILGEELFKQLETAVNAYNGNEANKDNQIKIGNLGSGEYVGKGKYDSLQALLDGKTAELDTANGLIAELKKGTKGNEEMQGKITAYEGQVAQLQKELEQTKIKSAVKVALLTAKAVDVDYLTFKLEEEMKEKGNSLKLDENENISGWNDLLDGLKTKFPNMFNAGDGDGGGFTPYEGGGLPKGEQGKTVTKDQFRSMSFEERMNLKKTNEALYKQYAKN